MVVCKYFLQGNCRYGYKCWFEHTRGGSGGGNNSKLNHLFVLFMFTFSLIFLLGNVCFHYISYQILYENCVSCMNILRIRDRFSMWLNKVKVVFFSVETRLKLAEKIHNYAGQNTSLDSLGFFSSSYNGHLFISC